MFFPSPRNSIVAKKELLARTDCRILLSWFRTPQGRQARQPKHVSGQGHYTTSSNSAVITLPLYAEQIEALYSESDMTPPSATPLDRECVTTTLRSMMTTITEWPQLHDDIDFFNQGMDSLQLLRLSASIRSRLVASVFPSVIYSNPQ